jgi:hypothetical protein
MIVPFFFLNFLTVLTDGQRVGLPKITNFNQLTFNKDKFNLKNNLGVEFFFFFF